MRDCYDTCSIVSWVENGKLRIKGSKLVPLTDGFLCPKGSKMPEWVHSEQRLKRPLIRKNGKLVESTWKEAISLVSGKISYFVKKGMADKILLYQYAGDRGIINYYFPMRLFHKIGATFLDYGVCDRAGQEALKRIYGTAVGLTPFEASKENLIVYWGMNPVWTNMHGFHWMRKHKLEVWSVDVRSSETSKKSDKSFVIKPGSDFLFAILIAKFMIENGLFDKSFVRSYVADFDEFVKFLSSIDYSLLEFVGLSMNELSEFAKDFYRKKGIIHIGYGFQRSMNGGLGVYFVSILPILVGHGCGFIYDMKTIDKNYVEGKFLRDKSFVSIPQMEIAKYIENGDIEMVFVYNSNPLNSHQNISRLKKAFEKVFLVVHDIFLTETALVADVVLPANTFFERLDFVDSYYHDYILLNQPVIKLFGKSNREVSVEIAKNLEIKDIYLYEDEKSIIKKVLDLNGLDFGEFFEKKVLKVPKRTKCKDKVYLTKTLNFNLENALQALKREEDSFVLLTPTHFMTITSQYYNIYGQFEPVAYLNPEDAKVIDLKSGDLVKIYNEFGRIVLKVKVSSDVQKGSIVVYKGSWKNINGVNVNELVGDLVQKDFANASIYHGYKVKIEKL